MHALTLEEKMHPKLSVLFLTIFHLIERSINML